MLSAYNVPPRDWSLSLAKVMSVAATTDMGRKPTSSTLQYRDVTVPLAVAGKVCFTDS
jgi:hypothetical protein